MSEREPHFEQEPAPLDLQRSTLGDLQSAADYFGIEPPEPSPEELHDPAWLLERRLEVFDAYYKRHPMAEWDPVVDKVLEAIEQGEQVVAVSGPYGIGKSTVFTPLVEERLRAAGRNTVPRGAVLDQSLLDDTELMAEVLELDNAVLVFGEMVGIQELDQDSEMEYREVARRLLARGDQLILITPGPNKVKRRDWLKAVAPQLDATILHTIDLGTLHLDEEPTRVLLRAQGLPDEAIEFIVNQPLLMGPRAFQQLIHEINHKRIEGTDELMQSLRNWIHRIPDTKIGRIDGMISVFNPFECNFGNTEEYTSFYEAMGEPLPAPELLHPIQTADPFDRN